VRRRSKNGVTEGSKHAHWMGLYLSFHLNWVLGLFVHDSLQNLQTSEVTFARVITTIKWVVEVECIDFFCDIEVAQWLKC